MAPFSSSVISGAGFDAVGVVVVGFRARYGSGFAVFLVKIIVVLVVTGWGVDDCWGPAAVCLRAEVLLFVLVEVGAGIGGFVFEHLHESVEAGREKRAKDGADPVDLSSLRVSVRDQLRNKAVIPNDSGGTYVRPPQGQRIELGLPIRRYKRHLKQSAHTMLGSIS